MATLCRMTKKDASSVIPLANIRIPHRNYIFSAPLETDGTTIRFVCTNNNITTNLSSHVSRATSIPTHRHILNNKGSNSEDSLLSLVVSEINCSEDKFYEFGEAPKEFPFKIVDNAGKDFIRLTREFQGEEIKVTVYGPYQPMDPRDSWWSEEEESEDDQSEEEEEEKSDPPEYVRLSICISNKSGQTLELNVTADAADEIEIYSKLRIKNPNASRHHTPYEEPNILDLDDELQEAFNTYLEVRGFEPSIGKFLCDYMVRRKDTKHTKWLKYLKNFIVFSSNDSSRYGKVSRATSVPAHHQSSALAEKKSNSDDTFLRVVESEIECAEEEFLEVIAEALREFPFKIEEEDAGKGSTTLTREYQGDEEIKVTVDRPEFRNCLHLKGIVSNKSGLTLELYGRVDAADGIRITSLQVKDPNASDHNIHYRGPTFRDLDKKVQNAFRTYLEDRGIGPSITKALYDCMVSKKHKKHTAWLKHLKNFIAN